MPKIIKATERDLEPLAELFDRYRIFNNMASDLNAAQNFIQQRLLKQDSIIYIALKNQTLLGFVQIYPSFSSVAMRPIWMINDLYVKTTSRNQGVATNLLEHLTDQAKQLKVFNLQLATSFENSQAQALYVKLGFRLNDGFKHYSKLI